MELFAVKGTIIYSKNLKELKICESGYLVCKDGVSQGVYEDLPEQWSDIEVIDYGNRMIIPGLVDLHIHAPQYVNRGIGMDMELLDWLNTYTFPEEGKYGDVEYAKAAYQIFVENLKNSGTTRICAFGTIHNEATTILAQLLEESGIRGFVGKVSMNRNAPEFLCEDEAEVQARAWIEDVSKTCKNIKPIVTPRFIPSCTDELMHELGKVQKEYGLPLQSHLSENEGEIAWVKELCPKSEFYGDAYDKSNTFGSNGVTVMAHCVHSDARERKLIAERGVYVAHCPESNTNLSSGIAPVRSFIEEGANIGLGTDISGGHELSMFRVMKAAIQVSKLYWRLIDQSKQPLSMEEAFYLATKGGGAFFGKVGSFEAGYEMDAVVIDDSDLNPMIQLDSRNRLERIVYGMQDEYIKDVYVAGSRI